MRCDITSINTLHTESMSRLLKCLAHQSPLTKLSYLANVVLLGIVIFLLLHRHKGDTEPVNSAVLDILSCSS